MSVNVPFRQDVQKQEVDVDLPLPQLKIRRSDYQGIPYMQLLHVLPVLLLLWEKLINYVTVMISKTLLVGQHVVSSQRITIGTSAEFYSFKVLSVSLCAQCMMKLLHLE